MQTLFGDVENKQKTELKIVARGQKALSKNQQLFNKLTKRIETLEKDIDSEEQKLNKLLEIHSKEITPVETSIANTRLQLAMTLDKATERNKFTKKQTENIREAILTFCNDAFRFIEPNPEQESLYNKWSRVSYKEELEQQESETKEMFSEMMNDMFGMNVDMDDLEGPDGFARFQEKMKDKFEQAQQKNQQKNQKKSQKAQAKEEAQKAKEELKNKSIRSIYIALAKLLHPDTETDPMLKAEKEEIMKQVTVAYDNKDLVALLKLEMEWVHKTSEHLEKMTDDKLKLYIGALKEQVAELEMEKFNLCNNPRYAQVSAYADMPEKYALNQIKKQKSNFKGILSSLNHFIEEFRSQNTKKQIVEFVSEFCEINEQNSFEDDWNDIFDDLRF
jgi:hypothetical protein